MNPEGTANGAGDEYVLGHKESELTRLERQASLFADPTRDILSRAGVGPGMKVFDLGSGVGDVSLVAADLVGPEGAVHGLEPAEEALSVARARMQAAGKHWVSFSQGTLEALEDLSDYDAVIGRFLLIHLPDPAAALKSLAAKMKPGAKLAFVEFDLTTAEARPPLPLMQECVDWVMEVYRRSGRHPDMGAGLYETYRKAGLAPDLIALTRITNGQDMAGFDFLAESIRSMLPAIQALGIADEASVGIDTLRDRLVAEAADGDFCIFYPRLVGAWAAA